MTTSNEPGDSREGLDFAEETVTDLESTTEPSGGSGGMPPNTGQCLSRDSFPQHCEPHTPTEWCS